MVQIREKMQRQLTSHDVDTQLLRTGLTLGTVRMFICIIVLDVKESAP